MKFDEKVCFFLGAGASRAFGYPTTVEFLKKLNGENSFLNNELWQSVIEIIQAIKKNETIDIEIILQEIEDFEDYLKELIEKDAFKKHYLLSENLFIRIHKGKQLPTETVDSFFRRHLQMAENLRNSIYRNIYNTYWDVPDSKEDFRDTYKYLFSLTKEDKVDIFTTNYDLCIENTFLKDDNLIDNFSDGFKSFQGDTIFKNDYNGDKIKYRLYKLHGSINWKRDPYNKETIYRVGFRDLSSDLNYHPLLYPGTGTKNINEFPFDAIYKNFEEELVKSNYCIVIGFSFRDEAITNIMQEALDRNKRLKFIIWNPKIPKHHLPMERVTVFNNSFTKSMVKEVVDIVNRAWMEESLPG